MITIRDEIAYAFAHDEIVYGCWSDGATGALKVLGIDPELPAEWATEERCRRWLDEHGGCTVHGPLYDHTGQRSGAYYGEYDQRLEAQTEHAVLINACQAVQKQRQP